MEGFSSLKAFEALADSAPATPPNIREIVVDVQSDMAGLDERLEHEHADAVRMFYKGSLLGVIPAKAGAERLAGVHIKAELADRFANVWLGLLANSPRPATAAEGERLQTHSQGTTTT
jgi:hypothetical protein